MAKPSDDRPGFVDRLLEIVTEPFLNLFLFRNAGAAGGIALLVAVFVASYELAPSKEAWVKAAAYGAVAAVGAVAGALLALDYFFHLFPQVPTPMPRAWALSVSLLAGLGMIPGVLLYGVGESGLSTPQQKEDRAKARLERRRQKRGLPAAE
jgi:hypothetical protein